MRTIWSVFVLVLTVMNQNCILCQVVSLRARCLFEFAIHLQVAHLCTLLQHFHVLLDK